jgi:hypothetical protein
LFASTQSFSWKIEHPSEPSVWQFCLSKAHHERKLNDPARFSPLGGVLCTEVRDGGEYMKILGTGGIVVAAAVMTAFPLGNNLNAKPSASFEVETNKEGTENRAPSVERGISSEQQEKSKEHEDYFSVREYSPVNLSLHPYVALPAERKPAEIVLESLKGVQIGTPLEEIKRASDVFGLDFTFMRTIAKIESDFDPKQRTGSYIGLFQLDRHEFATYGSGDITNPRDNAIAAAYKFATEARLFESDTHKKPAFSDLYLIHQQGWQGAAEHVSQPDRIAWKSMCATDEGRQKGEKWCKRAIWENTLPTVKHIWKSVDKLTSGAFVDMWRERVDRLYARYSEAISEGSAD